MDFILRLCFMIDRWWFKGRTMLPGQAQA